MNLVVFDLDGTLLDTMAVDYRCFVQALKAEFDALVPDGQWGNFEHATDAFITAQVYRNRHGRDPSPADMNRFVRCLEVLLREQAAIGPAFFAPIPGAAALLEYLDKSPDWAVALATGCWRASARVKMAAGLPAAARPARR